MRSLLALSSLGCVIALSLATMVWHRSDRATDWLRINALGGSAVVALSQQHIGAVIIPDLSGWVVNDRPILYRHFEPMNLLSKFSGNVFGFGYRRDAGAHLAVVPLWAPCAAACFPPLAFLATRRRRRA